VGQAYDGPAAAEVPADLADALDGEPRARAVLEILTSQNRYAIPYRIQNTRTPATRARAIERLLAMLARGESIHPQRRGLQR
jgi:uncharacterized protein YdeI (YjbR/CyaY-like superfamily)